MAKKTWLEKLDLLGVEQYESRFDSDNNLIFDIPDEYTSELLGERGKLWGIKPDTEAFENIETAFIDSVWGTDGAGVHTYDGNEAWKDPSSGYNATYGLDLPRVYDKDLIPGSPEMSKYLAKGPIDWAYINNDPEYRKALKSIGVDDITDPNLSESWKASKFREARIKAADNLENNSGMKEPTEWEGMYDENKIRTDQNGDLWIDGKRQPTTLELLQDPNQRYQPKNDEWWQANKIHKETYKERDINDLRSSEYRDTLNLPTKADFGLSSATVKVKKPGNLPVPQPTKGA
tara:strand:+ start:196 stop:1065 length:870 start_codon:yes stop_codon:yes gene_type:complete